MTPGLHFRRPPSRDIEGME